MAIGWLVSLSLCFKLRDMERVLVVEVMRGLGLEKLRFREPKILFDCAIIMSHAYIVDRSLISALIESYTIR